MFVRTLLVSGLLIKISLAMYYGSSLRVSDLAYKAYNVLDGKMTFNEAAVECRDRQRSLVMIENEREFEHLKNYINSHYDLNVSYWVKGFGYENESGEWGWFWADNKIKKFFWHQGEPKVETGERYCIRTWERDFDWRSTSCFDNKFNAICEIHMSL